LSLWEISTASGSERDFAGHALMEATLATARGTDPDTQQGVEGDPHPAQPSLPLAVLTQTRNTL